MCRICKVHIVNNGKSIDPRYLQAAGRHTRRESTFQLTTHFASFCADDMTKQGKLFVQSADYMYSELNAQQRLWLMSIPITRPIALNSAHSRGIEISSSVGLTRSSRQPR